MEFGVLPSNVSDALVHSHSSTTNYGTNEWLQAARGTNRGTLRTLRSFIRFDDFPGTLPSNAVIDSAKLEFYVEMLSGWTYTTPNDCYVQRVRDNWDESTLNWTNQPGVYTTDQVTTASYPRYHTGWGNVSVTDHVRYFKENPDDYQGWRFQLTVEQPHRMLYMRSSDYDSGSRSPKLKVWYHIPPLPGMYLSTTNTEGLIFNADRSGVVLDADFTSNAAFLQSEQLSETNSGEVEFAVGAGFVGEIGLDTDSRIDRKSFSVHFRYDGEKYYLFDDVDEITSAILDPEAEYKFVRSGSTVDIYVDGVSIHSATVTQQQERIQIVGESEGTVHLPYFRSDFKWPNDPFGEITYSDLDGSGGGKISIQKGDGYYYLWNQTVDQILTCSQLNSLNSDRTTETEEDEFIDISAFGGTQSCTEYFDSLGNAISYYSNGAFPTVLTAYNPSSEESYTLIFELPDEIIPAYAGNAMSISDTKWERTNTVTEFDSNGLFIPANGTEGGTYSSIRFTIDDFNSEFAIGLLKPGWDVDQAVLPNYGVFIEGGEAQVIWEGQVESGTTSLTTGDQWQVGKLDGEFYVLQNGVSVFQETIGQEDHALGAVVKGGKIVGPELIGSSQLPQVTIANPSSYCSLDNTSNFIYNALVKPSPVFDGLIKTPKNGAYLTQYQWKNQSGTIVSNTSNLTTAQPGIYQLEVISFTPFATYKQVVQNVAIGYEIEWKQLNGTSVPQAHAIQAIAPGNMGSTNPYPITLVNANSSNKIKEVNNLDFLSFSIPKNTFTTSSQPHNPMMHWSPRDVLNFVDDAGMPLLSVLIAYDIETSNLFTFPYPFYVKWMKPRYASIRYHFGPAQWVDLSPYTGGSGDLSFVVTYDYTTDEAKLYGGGQLLLTVPVYSGAIIGGTASQPQNLKVYYSYIHNESFTSSGFDYASDGMRDILCSRSCESIPYYEMWSRANGNTVLSYQNMRGIRFYEDYTSVNKELDFKLYNNLGVSQPIPSGVSLAKEFGENRILLRLTDLNIIKGESYLLEAANEKGEKRYIRFTY